MDVAFFSTKTHDRASFLDANGGHGHALAFLEPRLTAATGVLAAGFPAVCVFVNDDVGATVLEGLAAQGTRLVALRSAGFSHVDLDAAHRQGLTVARVPAYSPFAVAEHTVGLILSLTRHIHRAYARVRDGNFALDGLLGFDLHARTVGVVGTGRIGVQVVRIMRGFGCRVLTSDPVRSAEGEAAGGIPVSLDVLLAESDIITLHCPLVPDTHHLIDERAFGRMRRGVMLINTSRGALVDANAAIAALKAGILGHLGLDVYEEEGDLFFQDLSAAVIHDDVFARLLTFPNVLITGHQAFFTKEAVQNIAETTLANITAFEQGQPLANEVTLELVRPPTPPATASTQGRGDPS
ncbi:MAG: 2-hydroxyacid dehydrogenase [Burkholderiales bacterium]